MLERVLRAEPPIDSGYDLGPEYRLFVQLVLTRDAVYKARQKELSEHGLTAEQSAVLGAIDALTHIGLADRITPAEIARMLFRESQSISELLDRMQRDGLVRKVKDLPRRNMVRVELTEMGEEVSASTRKADVIRRTVARLSGEQREQVSTCLEILRLAALEELGVDDVRLSFGSSGEILTDGDRPRRKRARSSTTEA